MIAAVIDASQPALDKLRFRDRDLKFWLTHFYPFCSFYPLPQAGLQFDFLFIFATVKFPAGAETAMRELKDWLKEQDSSKPWLVAPEGKPFFIASRAFVAAMHIKLSHGVFKRLRAEKKTGLLALRNPVPVFHPETGARQIESAVIDLQIRSLQKKGVRVEDYNNFFISGLLPIGKNTTIGSGVVISGESRIGKNVRLYPNCFIENSVIGDQCLVLPGSIIRDSIIEKNVQLGPYCHVRNGSLVKKGAKMGNFVEIKKSVLGQGSKAMHLSYIGDARVGKKTNIGAGTITCNYDGVKKNPTTIGDNVFIGSGTELVAPVTIHSHSYVGAGSTITEDVPRNALAIARQRQKNVSGWVLRKRKKK